MNRSPMPPRKSEMKRTEMKRGTKPINPVSKRRAKVNRQRAKNLVEAWGPRPWKCRFPQIMLETGIIPANVAYWKCSGEVNGHEVLKRTRSGKDSNLLDIEGIEPLCDFHNDHVEQFPKEAQLMGLADPSGPSTKSVQYPNKENE